MEKRKEYEPKPEQPNDGRFWISEYMLRNGGAKRFFKARFLVPTNIDSNLKYDDASDVINELFSDNKRVGPNKKPYEF